MPRRKPRTSQHGPVVDRLDLVDYFRSQGASENRARFVADRCFVQLIVSGACVVVCINCDNLPIPSGCACGSRRVHGGNHTANPSHWVLLRRSVAYLPDQLPKEIAPINVPRILEWRNYLRAQ